MHMSSSLPNTQFNMCPFYYNIFLLVASVDLVDGFGQSFGKDNIPTYFGGGFLAREAFCSLVPFFRKGWLEENFGSTRWADVGTQT